MDAEAMSLGESLSADLRDALKRLCADGVLPRDDYSIELRANADHERGDYSTNIAFKIAADK